MKEIIRSTDAPNDQPHTFRCIRAAHPKQYGVGEQYPKKTFEDVFKSIINEETDYALLPIENTLGGSIHVNYDLLLKYPNITTGDFPVLKDLGITGTQIQSILPKYIYRFRSGGQFG